MNNRELTNAVAQAMGDSPATTERLLNSLTQIMGEHFAKGDSVQLSGLGTFEVRKKMERIITNPASGQRMLVPPKLVLAYKPLASMKERISNTEE